MKSSGPNVSVLHLRSTSEPWINDEGEVLPSIKLILKMDSQGNLLRNPEHEEDLLLKTSANNNIYPSPTKKKSSVLPRHEINNLSNENNRSYMQNKKNYYVNDSPQVINLIEPPITFLNEYNEDYYFTPRKTYKSDLKINSYYPILSPPPGFQDEIMIENSENISDFHSCNNTPYSHFSNFRTKNNLSKNYSQDMVIGNQKRNNNIIMSPEKNTMRLIDLPQPHQRRFVACNCHRNAENFQHAIPVMYELENERLLRPCKKDDIYPQSPDEYYYKRNGFMQYTSNKLHKNANYLHQNGNEMHKLKNNYSVESFDVPQKHKIRRAVSFHNSFDTSHQDEYSCLNEYRNNTMKCKNIKRRYNFRKISSTDADFKFWEPSNLDPLLSKRFSTLHSQFFYYHPKQTFDMKTEQCSCYPENTRRFELPFETFNNYNTTNESEQYKRDFDYALGKAEIESVMLKNIYPQSKNDKNMKEISNPPDIANVPNSHVQNRYLHDVEFIRKQPDVLQSAYRRNRILKSPSDHAVINYYPAHFPSNNNFCLEEIKKKSSSLPKSFQNENCDLKGEVKLKDHPALLFHWKKNGLKGLLSNKKIIVPCTVMSETAPTTPIKDMPEKKKYGRLMKVGQYSSTPSLEDNSVKHINFGCDNRLRKDKFKSSKTATLNNGDFRLSSQENIISDGVFHKFCKSFSLRFLRKPSDDNTHKTENSHSSLVTAKLKNDFNETTKKQTNRFGPLSWRSSKERKGKTHNSRINNEEQENVTQNTLQKIEKESTLQLDHQQRLIRRTLSDLNGYCSVVKDKHFNSTVPTKYRPPVPVAVKKYKQYNLRRTMSQPLLGSKFSPALRKKCIPCKTPCSEDERAFFSDDDMMSDSGSSLPSGKNSFEQGINEEIVIFAEAVWDHIAIESEELPFNAGDVIEVYNVLDREWWWGMCNGKSGWFPSDFVRLRINQEETLQNQLSNSPTRQFPSLSMYSNEQLRSKIVCELLNTEKDFVKILKNVKEAYIIECRNTKELFTREQICKIFGNWEQILSFQSAFLDDLEINFDPIVPYKTCVGDSFLKFRDHFRMYSDYCNNHPLSIATLQQLYQQLEYRNFFEKCRIQKNLIEIPLDGFLLTPIQRICKYPLQLAELLKHTEPEHSDYNLVKNALNAMREVAILINERKRRMESLEKLILWQQRIEGWEGSNLIENSSQLIYQNDVTKVFAGVWCTNVTLFLFDHQLVFCKKDLLKKDCYVYKGRIFLDNCDVIDTPDGKDALLGINVRNGVKIQNVEKNKWLLFCCRTYKEKLEWIEAFRKEKELVLMDERTNLQITPMDRHLAYITATTCNTRHVFLKHKNKKLKRSLHNNGYLSRNIGSSHILGRKVGTWFTFGTHRKNHQRINTKNHVTAI